MALGEYAFDGLVNVPLLVQCGHDDVDEHSGGRVGHLASAHRGVRHGLRTRTRGATKLAIGTFGRFARDRRIVPIPPYRTGGYRASVSMRSNGSERVSAELLNANAQIGRAHV